VLLSAWAVTFADAFVRSVVPTPMLIDWKSIHSDLSAYVQATDEHFELTAVMHAMHDLADKAGQVCQKDVIYEKAFFWKGARKKAHEQVDWWCRQIQSGSHWFPRNVFLQTSSHQCQIGVNYLEFMDRALGETWKQKEKFCGKINKAETKVKIDSLGSLKEAVTGALRSPAYIAVGLYSGLLSFQVLLPVALSVAPGLLNAALRIKVMVPQSHLPGVFIVLMPLMYMPIVWACGACIVQSIGEIFPMVALVSMALSPAGYTVLGIAKAVTSPMTPSRVLAFYQDAEKWSWVCKFVTLCCFGLYISKICRQIQEIEERNEGLAALVLEQARKLLLPLLLGKVASMGSLLLSGVVWSMLFTLMTATLLTTVVGADWMMRSTVDEWHVQEGYYKEMQEELQYDNNHFPQLRDGYVTQMKAMLHLVTHQRSSDAAAEV